MQSQSYHNLSLRCRKDDSPEWTSKTKIENGLEGYDAIVTENQEGFTIYIKGFVQCDVKPLTYSILIDNDLTVSLRVSEKFIDLRQYAISTSLVALSSQKIQILAKSIMSLKICYGVQFYHAHASSLNKIINWTMANGTKEKCIHSRKCAIFLPLASTANKCVKCRKSVQAKSELLAHGEDPENQDNINHNQIGTGAAMSKTDTPIKPPVNISDSTSTTPEILTPPAQK